MLKCVSHTGIPTFTAANDKVLISATKGTAKDEFALLLAHESPNDIRRIQIKQLNFVVSHVDKDVSGVAADVYTSHF